MVREIDKASTFGQEALSFLEKEGARRAAKRKHQDQSFLVYKRASKGRSHPINLKASKMTPCKFPARA